MARFFFIFYALSFELNFVLDRRFSLIGKTQEGLIVVTVG